MGCKAGERTAFELVCNTQIHAGGWCRAVGVCVCPWIVHRAFTWMLWLWKDRSLVSWRDLKILQVFVLAARVICLQIQSTRISWISSAIRALWWWHSYSRLHNVCQWICRKLCVSPPRSMENIWSLPLRNPHTAVCIIIFCSNSLLSASPSLLLFLVLVP